MDGRTAISFWDTPQLSDLDTNDPYGEKEQAIDRLAVDRCPEGDDAMMLAEYGWNSPRIELVGLTPSLRDLKDGLERVLTELG